MTNNKLRYEWIELADGRQAIRRWTPPVIKRGLFGRSKVVKCGYWKFWSFRYSSWEVASYASIVLPSKSNPWSTKVDGKTPTYAHSFKEKWDSTGAAPKALHVKQGYSDPEVQDAA